MLGRLAPVATTAMLGVMLTLGSSAAAASARVPGAAAASARAAGAAARPAYVALGDSYASGDGTGVYYKTDGACYRSRDAYPALVAVAKGYALDFAACSGATTADVVSRQLGGLRRSTALVTVEVGGNDAGLIHVLEQCALDHATCEHAIKGADSYIVHSLPAGLNAGYTAIRRAAPKAEVIIVGYPRLFTASGSTCGARLLTSAEERALNQTADLLDSVIAGRAASHGFRWVDPRGAFASHELCSRAPWINNLTFPAVQESYHPNVGGEAAYSRLIEGVLRGSGQAR